MSAVILLGTSKQTEAQKREFQEAGFTCKETAAMHLGRGVWLVRVDLTSPEDTRS